VYHLDGEGSWADQGTGYASITDKCIYCHAEEGEAAILEAPISMEVIYQRQGETIISWNDPTVGMDLALSFQEAENCQAVWEELCAVQGRAEEGAFPAESPTYSGAGEEGQGGQGAELPEPTVGNLEEIAKLFENCTMFQRDAIAQAFTKQGFVKKLLEAYEICDDLENTECLHFIFRIFKGAIMLNDNCLLEMLLSDEYLMEMVACLEHDPELLEVQKHREFLTKTAVFKEVVPIRDERVGARIHQNFRVA